MRYEILNGQTVVNTIMASADYMTSNYVAGSYRLAVDVIPVVVPNTKITRLAYLNRLGPKLATIYTMAQSNVSVQIYKDKVFAADFVDLADPQVADGLAVMKANNVYTAAEIAQILTAPITDLEAYKG